MNVSSQNHLIEQLKEVGNKLLEPPSSIPELINLLDEVEHLLTKVWQAPSKPVQEALVIPMEALIGDQLIRHPDPNVRVTIASCLNEIMRITAPFQPYEDDDKMREIFKLIVSSFENLSCQPGRCYSKSVLILQNVAKLRSCVMMLDLQCDLLIIKMFELFQRNTSPKHPHSVVIAMEKIMSVLIQESDSVPRELLEVLLSSIRKENQSALPASCALGAKIIEECADKLKPHILETVSSMGCCLEDFAPILSSICKDEHVILNSATNVSSNQQLVHDEPSAPVECVQALMAVEHHGHGQGSRAGKAFGTEPGTASRRKRKPNCQNFGQGLENGINRLKASLENPGSQLKRSSVVSGNIEGDLSGVKTEEITDHQSEKAHLVTSLDDVIKREVAKNDSSGRSARKSVNQKEVSPVPGSFKPKRPQKDHSLGSGNKSELGQCRKDQIQLNNGSKNQRKRASSDDDVIETPHGRKHYKHDLVGSRIKVWWPLDHRYYEGTITSFDDSTRKHKVDYDDGDEEVLNLRKEQWEFLGDESPTDMDLFG